MTTQEYKCSHFGNFNMRLLGRQQLSRLREEDERIEKWVLSWVAEIEAAHWKHPSDVIEQFPNAHHTGDYRFLFPVGNYRWAICLLIAFPQGIALITELNAKDETLGT